MPPRIRMNLFSGTTSYVHTTPFSAGGARTSQQSRPRFSATHVLRRPMFARLGGAVPCGSCGH